MKEPRVPFPVGDEGQARGLTEGSPEAGVGDDGHRRAARQARNWIALTRPVEEVKGVGTSLLRQLHALDIATVEDLLHHFPRRYLDRRKLTPISEVRIGDEVTVVGTVRQAAVTPLSGRRNLLTVTLYDGSAYLHGVWFNQPYHADRLKPGTVAAFSGKVQFRFGKLQMVNPSYDIVEDLREVGRRTVHTGRVIPLHPATQKLSAAMLRRLVMRALDQFGDLPDPLPLSLRLRYGFPHVSRALREMHFPTSRGRLNRARQRMAYEELFLLQTALLLRKRRNREEVRGISFAPPGEKLKRFIEGLPFRLTGSQERAFRDIVKDMTEPYPMNRLLQGEVGSGKTVVALLSLLLAWENGYQGTMMAPTEILAEQHFRNLSSLLADFAGVRMELLTGSTSSSRRREILEKAASGEVDILVGTHALIQEDVNFRRLGLVVVDEQHRFGVRQRMLLKSKGVSPDTLIMTATPIPRTLSLTLYGDLEVSVMEELPAGRAETKTVVLDPSRRDEAYGIVEKELEAGRQAYVVCPLVDTSPQVEAKAAEKEAGILRDRFAGFSVGLLHGQMPREEREEVMEGFRNGEVQLLVCTTVIEVGIDVPNATVMLVENADRFGLSQLHQLRGRVGRGPYPSYCILLFKGDTEESMRRMKAVSGISDGFRLAEADLEIRGEGTIFGTRQSGAVDLRVARLIKDYHLLEKARRDAAFILDKDPFLQEPDHALLAEEVKRRFGGNLEWIFHA